MLWMVRTYAGWCTILQLVILISKPDATIDPIDAVLTIFGGVKALSSTMKEMEPLLGEMTKRQIIFLRMVALQFVIYTLPD
jgi:hypothetical protein